MINFLKGIIVGMGGIAPGLSGSVLLVILGLYQKTINAIGTLFKDIKNNIKFLLPLILGFGIGVILFSKIVNFFLNTYEMYTRFVFLGLVLGTIPLFYREVKKEGISKKHYVIITISAVIGFGLFFFNNNLFPNVSNPNLIQSTLLGVAVAGSSIVPGIDSAVILSTLGLYELYVSSLANFNFGILIPAGFGLIFGAIVISIIMNKLIKNHYTVTFSVIFGMFLAIIPNILTEKCVLGFNGASAISVILLLCGFVVSYFLGNVKENADKVKNSFKYVKELYKKSKKSLAKKF